MPAESHSSRTARGADPPCQSLPCFSKKEPCNRRSIPRINNGKRLLGTPVAVIQPSLFPTPVDPALPPGLLYCADVLTPDDERGLLARIVDLPYKEFQFHGFRGKRRVISFGWRYDFSEHKALPADPIPDFLLEIHSTIQTASGFAVADLAQVLVTEYTPGAPIGWHKDRPFFGDVMGLSLVSACNFRLRKPLVQREVAARFAASRTPLCLSPEERSAPGMGTQHSAR